MNLIIDKRDWKKTKLADVVDWYQKDIPNDVQAKYGIQFYVTANHIDGDSVKFDRYNNLDDSQKGPTITKHFEKGDLLLSTRSVALRKAAIAPIDGVTGEKLLVLRVKKNSELINQLFPFVFQSADFWEFAQNSASGSVNKFTSWTKIREYEFLLPPKDQQAQLAELLWAMDEVVEKEKNLHHFIQQSKLSTIESFFLPPITKESRIGLIRSDADIYTISSLAKPDKYSCVGGPFGSRLTSKHYVFDGGVPVIRGGNLAEGETSFYEEEFVYVSHEKAEELSSNLAYPGDLIVTQRGTLGQVGLIPLNSKYPKYVVSQSQMKLTPNNEIVKSKYLYYYFKSRWAQEHINKVAIATGVPHINLQIFRDFPVIVPPVDKQDSFIHKIEVMEKAEELSRLKILDSFNLQKSLINQIF